MSFEQKQGSFAAWVLGAASVKDKNGYELELPATHTLRFNFRSTTVATSWDTIWRNNVTYVTHQVGQPATHPPIN